MNGKVRSDFIVSLGIGAALGRLTNVAVVLSFLAVAHLLCDWDLRCHAASLSWVRPFVIAKGQTNRISIACPVSRWPLSIWTEAESQLAIRACSDLEGSFEVIPSPNAEDGAVWCRLYSTNYIGPLFLVSIEQNPVVFDILSTNVVETVELISLPVVIGGLLSKTNLTDRWIMNLTEPARIEIEASALGFGVPLWLDLELEDAAGTVRRQSQADVAADPEPILDRLPAGRWTIVVSATRRPRTMSDPFVTSYVLPYRLGIRIERLEPESLETRLALLGGQEEQTPKGIRVATWVDPPATIHGVIGGPGDCDRYAISLHGGQRLTIRLRARSLGSELEPVVRIEDPSGATLLSRLGPDLDLELEALVTGGHFVVVNDRDGRGGPGYFYELEVFKPTSPASFKVQREPLSVSAGSRFDIPIKIEAFGSDDRAISIVPIGLPEGLQLDPTLAGPGIDHVTLSGTAAPSVKVGAYWFRLQALILKLSGSPETRFVRVALDDSIIPPESLIKPAPEWVWIQVVQ